jgi:hypothetical protein
MLVIVGGDGGTDFIPTKLPNIPKFSFNFKPFSEIKTGKYRDDLLVGNIFIHQQLIINVLVH